MKNMVAKSAFKYLDSLVIYFFYFGVQKIPNKLVAVKRVIVRTLKLLFWGLLLQG